MSGYWIPLAAQPSVSVVPCSLRSGCDLGASARRCRCLRCGSGRMSWVKCTTTDARLFRDTAIAVPLIRLNRPICAGILCSDHGHPLRAGPFRAVSSS